VNEVRSDLRIHSKLPALEAILADVDGREGADMVYDLGDLVSDAPWPNETTTRLRGAGYLRSYDDSTVATDYKHCGCKAESPGTEEQFHESCALFTGK
jgi:hypothetical protein